MGPTHTTVQHVGVGSFRGGFVARHFAGPAWAKVGMITVPKKFQAPTGFTSWIWEGSALGSNTGACGGILGHLESAEAQVQGFLHSETATSLFMSILAGHS